MCNKYTNCWLNRISLAVKAVHFTIHTVEVLVKGGDVCSALHVVYMYMYVHISPIPWSVIGAHNQKASE